MLSENVFIIAEIGSNHNKDKSILREMIDLAAEAGVDAVKLQTIFKDSVASSKVKTEAYGTFPEMEKYATWSAYHNDIVLPLEWHEWAFEYARSKGLIAFSTPESVEAVDFLDALHVPLFKVASMDITYKDLLLKIAGKGKPVIFSTGMSTDFEIMQAYEWLATGLSDANIAVLYCVSHYPANFEDLNLRKIERLRELFPDLTLGFSDHSPGIESSVAAVALGARIIEKHFTLNKNFVGPDHSFALEPEELKSLVRSVRNVEKALKRHSSKSVTDCGNASLYRRSLVYSRDLSSGDLVKDTDLNALRPGTGIPPYLKEIVIGRFLQKDVKKGDVVSPDDWK